MYLFICNSHLQTWIVQSIIMAGKVEIIFLLSLYEHAHIVLITIFMTLWLSFGLSCSHFRFEQGKITRNVPYRVRALKHLYSCFFFFSTFLTRSIEKHSYGIFVPLILSIPFHLVTWLNIMSPVMKLAISVQSALSAFRCMGGE